jgi:hypothetical protein
MFKLLLVGWLCHETSVLTLHLPSSARKTLPFYKHFNKHYTSKCNTKTLLDDLKKIGVDKCHYSIRKNTRNSADWPDKGYKHSICYYNTGFFSLDPFQSCSIAVYSNQHDKIVKVKVLKNPIELFP